MNEVSSSLHPVDDQLGQLVIRSEKGSSREDRCWQVLDAKVDQGENLHSYEMGEGSLPSDLSPDFGLVSSKEVLKNSRCFTKQKTFKASWKPQSLSGDWGFHFYALPKFSNPLSSTCPRLDWRSHMFAGGWQTTS